MKHNAMANNVRTRISALAMMTIMFRTGKDLMAQTNTSAAVKNIVPVHGGLVDGSGWKAGILGKRDAVKATAKAAEALINAAIA
jgi:hypothetical protein